MLLLPQQSPHPRHLPGKFSEIAPAVQRVAQPQQRQGIPPLHLLRAAPQHRGGQLGVAHVSEPLGDQPHQPAREDALVVPGPEKAVHGGAGGVVVPIPLPGPPIDAPPRLLVRLVQPCAEKAQQQLVGIISAPQRVLPHQRHAAEKVVPLLRGQHPGGQQRVQHRRRNAVEQAEIQQRRALPRLHPRPEQAVQQLVHLAGHAARLYAQRRRCRPAAGAGHDGVGLRLGQRLAPPCGKGQNVLPRQQQVTGAQKADAPLQPVKNRPQRA